jgi:drug/metabolite transporter (DMT)-like permease
MKQLPNFKGAIYIITAAFLYALLPILAKVGYSVGLDPGSTLLLRYAFTVVLLFTAMFIMGQREVLWFSPAVIIQGIVFIGSGILYFMALQTLSAGLTSVIFFIHPVFVALLSILIFKEKFDPFLTIGICLVVFGIILISGLGKGAPPDLQGILLAFLSCLGYGAYSLIGQHTLGKHQPLSIAFTISLISMVVLLVVFHNHIPNLVNITAAQLGLTVAMAFFTNLGAVVLFLKGLQKIGASRATLLGSLEPFFTLLMAFAVLGERFDKFEVWGSSLILVGMFLAVFHAEGKHIN